MKAILVKEATRKDKADLVVTLETSVETDVIEFQKNTYEASAEKVADITVFYEKTLGARDRRKIYRFKGAPISSCCTSKWNLFQNRNHASRYYKESFVW